MKNFMEFAKENGKKAVILGGVIVAVIAVAVYAITKNGSEDGYSSDDVEVEVEFETE